MNLQYPTIIGIEVNYLFGPPHFCCKRYFVDLALLFLAEYFFAVFGFGISGLLDEKLTVLSPINTCII